MYYIFYSIFIFIQHCGINMIYTVLNCIFFFCCKPVRIFLLLVCSNEIQILSFVFCFKENLIRSQRRSARSGDLRLLGTFLTDNQVLIWKFNRLDRNKDKHLEQNEFLTSRMKKHLGHVKRGRKCGKKLFECDTDKDKKLSMVEWALCLRPGRVILLQ